MHLAWAAKVVRREVFNKSKKFPIQWVIFGKEVIPKSLLTLVNIIFEGPNVKYQTKKGTFLLAKMLIHTYNFSVQL